VIVAGDSEISSAVKQLLSELALAEHPMHLPGEFEDDQSSGHPVDNNVAARNENGTG